MSGPADPPSGTAPAAPPSTPPARRAALEREAHLWLARPDAALEPELLGAWRGLLSPEERAQHDRYRVDRARRLFLTGRALVRTTLSRYADVDPRDWRFEFGPHGRPEICGPAGIPPLTFNLSHTAGLVACLVTLGLEVGVDVESTRREVRERRLAEHSFAPSEAAAVAEAPDAGLAERFFSYWTLKEAYIKARGMGLALPLKRFAFSFPEPGCVRVAFDPELGDREADWQLALFRAGEHHLVAAAIRRGARPDLEIVARRVVALGAGTRPAELREIARSGPRS